MMIPAEVFPPGDFIHEELEARGWSQAELAAMIKYDEGVVTAVITAKLQLNVELAQALANALGTSPQFWMGLETSYQSRKLPAQDTQSHGSSVAL